MASPERAIRRKVIEPDGRTVVLYEDTWDLIRDKHRDMRLYERAIIETITHPDHRQADERPSRERYFKQGQGPAEWLRVVVDFSGGQGEVVTAFGHNNEQ